jgi:aminoglycoside phosphotransferase (APT) family kinase protein
MPLAALRHLLLRASTGAMTPEVSLGWLAAWSVEAVQDVLRGAGPSLADDPIALDGDVDWSNPKWSAGRALIGGRLIAKFACSEPTARRLWHEAQVLRVLGSRSEFRVPQIVVASTDPVFFATRLVTAGVPLSYELVAAAIPARIKQIGEELGQFFLHLHHPEILELVGDAVGRPVRIPDPGPQATTDELRHRLTRLVRPEQVAQILRWCAWVDQVLATPREPVFVHGDFHGYNQLWNPNDLRLRLVADFETSGAAQPEYDLRAILALGPGVDLLTATTSAYEARGGQPLSLEHIMAWHVRTTLGDAMWRTEAGVPLLLPTPGGGTPANYVEELQARFELLHLHP